MVACIIGIIIVSSAGGTSSRVEGLKPLVRHTHVTRTPLTRTHCSWHMAFSFSWSLSFFFLLAVSFPFENVSTISFLFLSFLVSLQGCLFATLCYNGYLKILEIPFVRNATGGKLHTNGGSRWKDANVCLAVATAAEQLALARLLE